MKHALKKIALETTCIVFRKFLGSSGSSKGYAPTSMTYKVTPQDHTSAIYNSKRMFNLLAYDRTMQFLTQVKIETLATTAVQADIYTSKENQWRQKIDVQQIIIKCKLASGENGSS